jgi:hypothetical protein
MRIRALLPLLAEDTGSEILAVAGDSTSAPASTQRIQKTYGGDPSYKGKPFFEEKFPCLKIKLQISESAGES